MAKQPNDKRTKSTFSAIRLAVTKNYVFPASRKLMMFAGGIGCAAFVLYFLLDALLLGNTFTSTGPLSSNHATFEKDCAKCHQSFRNVTDSKCSTCHEKTNDRLGVYTFVSHYVYRSGDASRTKTAQAKHASKEMQCASCHPDHRGRETKITEVADAKCVTCHLYGSFNSDHQEFEFARTQLPDDSTLIFTHIRHSKFVLEKLQKETGTVYIERACLHCHIPQSDGKSFKPIDYDMNCGDCHLTASMESASLMVKDPTDPNSPGVETLDMTQRRRGPGTQWVFYTSPNEFTTRGGNKVVKSPIYHEDPWILENLKQIRQTLYPDDGLSDLLKASGFNPRIMRSDQYNEAISTLQGYVLGLRSRPEPEVQSELARIDSFLRVLKGRTMMASDNFDSSFMMKTENPDLTLVQRDDLEEFAFKLTKPCLQCHIVSKANIMQVKADQRTLIRSEFDHRAHIVERRCLECHTEIPVSEVLVDKDTNAALLVKDRSTTQNIPKISNCVECHSASKASNMCVTCHFMHPNKENRGNLELFVEKP